MKLTEKINAFNVDCMDHMKNVPDNYYDLAIVDPPYGINAEQGTNKASRRNFKDKKYGWDSKAPSSEYFKELFRVSKNQIIWGANHFIESIPNANSKHWVIWDKHNPGRCFADCEMAWGSNIDNARIPQIKRVQELNRSEGGKIHPTQKPTQLYKWLIMNYAKEGDKILDTHGGSFSHAIACHILGFELDICEMDEDYFEASVKRFNQHVAQQTLF